MQFVLASQSPARLRILREAGIDPIVRVSEVDEEAVLEALPHASADEKVRALATAKGHAVASAIVEGRINVPEAGKLPRECVLVACDSMLESGGKLLGKPHDPQTALTRVKELSMSQATCGADTTWSTYAKTLQGGRFLQIVLTAAQPRSVSERLAKKKQPHTLPQVNL